MPFDSILSHKKPLSDRFVGHSAAYTLQYGNLPDRDNGVGMSRYWWSAEVFCPDFRVPCSGRFSGVWRIIKEIPGKGTQRKQRFFYP